MLSARLAAGSVRIEVEDIGEGIDPADLRAFIDRSKQGPASDTPGSAREGGSR